MNLMLVGLGEAPKWATWLTTELGESRLRVSR
jgi:hypothetical protein